MRGPDSYKTEFEQSLFLSYLGFIVRDCLFYPSKPNKEHVAFFFILLFCLHVLTRCQFTETLSLKKDCFLEDKKWTDAIMSMAVHHPPNSERHYLVLKQWTLVFPISRLFRLTTNCIMSINEEDPDLIIAECHQVHSNLIAWRNEYGNFALQHNACKGGNFKAREFIGGSYASQLLLLRCIVALGPLRSEARQLEAEVQQMAAIIARLDEESRWSENWECDALMAKKVVFGEAARKSKDEWLGAVNGKRKFLAKGRAVISAVVFARWDRLHGKDFEGRNC